MSNLPSTGELREKPDFLFKYAAFNSHALSLIQNKELFFARPDELNDPFDCHILLESDCSREEWDHFWQSTLKQLSSPMAADIGRFGSKYSDKDNTGNWFMRTAREITGVCCFSTTENNMLMWSHYADRHSGVCLVFKASNEVAPNDPLSLIEPVRYQQIYPRVNILNVGFYSALDTMLLTKSMVWEYENEWRAFSTPGTKYPLETYKLWAIIMGLGISEENKEILINLANNEKLGLKIAKRLPNAFGIEFQVLREPG